MGKFRNIGLCLQLCMTNLYLSALNKVVAADSLTHGKLVESDQPSQPQPQATLDLTEEQQILVKDGKPASKRIELACFAHLRLESPPHPGVLRVEF